MRLPTSRTSWRKSSYSGNGGADCVEVSLIGPSMAVRDSKNPGPVLQLSPAQASWFRAFAKGGQFDA